MKLICYLNGRPPLDIQPAGLSRDWMENSVDRFAYRCLPLNIANTHGWEIRCETTFQATWNGGSQINDILIKAASPSQAAISHFGSGVLTFHVSCVFRTEPGWNLMVMGPPNRPKRGIQALTGVVETDWSPYSFTMNWIFTEPHHTIEFQQGEPFCFFFPVLQGAIDAVNPVFSEMQSDAELYHQHMEWIRSRGNFIQDLAKSDSQASQEKWQRKYFHGQDMNGQVGSAKHQTKIKPKPFSPFKQFKIV